MKHHVTGYAIFLILNYFPLDKTLFQLAEIWRMNYSPHFAVHHGFCCGARRCFQFSINDRGVRKHIFAHDRIKLLVFPYHSDRVIMKKRLDRLVRFHFPGHRGCGKQRRRRQPIVWWKKLHHRNGGGNDRGGRKECRTGNLKKIRQ